MSRLRYRWGDGDAQDSASLPSATTVSLETWRIERGAANSRHRVPVVLWRGNVSTELRAWMRWCALQVVELWDCPSVVRRWLETGDPDLQIVARDEAFNICDRAPDGAAKEAASCAGWSGSYYGLYAVKHTSESSIRAWMLGGYGDSKGGRLVAMAARQEKHLRRLLLQRALPEPLWPLIDGDDDRVLCDALLEACP